MPFGGYFAQPSALKVVDFTFLMNSPFIFLNAIRHSRSIEIVFLKKALAVHIAGDKLVAFSVTDGVKVNQIKNNPLFQFNDSREIISHLHDSQLILSRERGRQVDVVCGVGEEGHLEHHVIVFEQLYGAVGVVVVEVEGYLQMALTDNPLKVWSPTPYQQLLSFISME